MAMKTGNLSTPLAIVIGSIVIFASLIGQSLIAEGGSKTIMVDGEATMKAAPDKAEVSFGVETEAETAKMSQDQNREVSNRIIETVSGFGIPSEDVKTTQFTVEPIQEFNPETRQFEDKGFRTVHIVTVAVKADNLGRVGEIADAVVGAGANRVNSLVFSLEEGTEKEIRKQVLESAARDARGKAEVIADALGTRVVGVRSVSESFSASPFFFGAAALEKSDSGEPTQIEPGQVDVSASVSVSFDIA